MKKIVFFILMVVLAAVATVEAAQVQVIKGDSLWQITEACGQPGFRWKELQNINPQLPKPFRRGGRDIVMVHPGDVLTLPTGWGAGSFNPSVVRYIPETLTDETYLPVSWWDRTRWWFSDHPWVWGLLGLFGLLGLLGLRSRREQVCPPNPTPSPNPNPQPPPAVSRVEVTVNFTNHCYHCSGPNRVESSLIAIPRTEVTIGEDGRWRTEVRHNLR